jgi:hypothetical protein
MCFVLSKGVGILLEIHIMLFDLTSYICYGYFTVYWKEIGVSHRIRISVFTTRIGLGNR